MLVSCIRRHGRACPGHPRPCCQAVKTWMPATSAGMTGNAIRFDPRRPSAVVRQNYRNRSRNPLKGEELARLAWLSCVRLRFCRALRGRRQNRQRHYFMASVRSVIKLNRQVGLPAERTEPLTILTDKSTKLPAARYRSGPVRHHTRRPLRSTCRCGPFFRLASAGEGACMNPASDIGLPKAEQVNRSARHRQVQSRRCVCNAPTARATRPA